jgi:hypothetical protein
MVKQGISWLRQWIFLSTHKFSPTSDQLFQRQSFSPYSELSKNVKNFKINPQIRIFSLGEICTIFNDFPIFLTNKIAPNKKS